MSPDKMIIPRPDCPVTAAARYFGSQAALAEALGYHPSAVAMWIYRGRIPKRAAVAIEMATEGQCPAESFREMMEETVNVRARNRS